MNWEPARLPCGMRVPQKPHQLRSKLQIARHETRQSQGIVQTTLQHDDCSDTMIPADGDSGCSKGGVHRGWQSWGVAGALACS